MPQGAGKAICAAERRRIGTNLEGERQNDNDKKAVHGGAIQAVPKGSSKVSDD
jgi:hypothetical protein